MVRFPLIQIVSKTHFLRLSDTPKMRISACRAVDLFEEVISLPGERFITRCITLSFAPFPMIQIVSKTHFLRLSDTPKMRISACRMVDLFMEVISWGEIYHSLHYSVSFAPFLMI